LADIPGTHDRKHYYVSTHTKASWTDAISICREYEMQFVSLDSCDEHNDFMKLIDEVNCLLEDSQTFIGGIATVPKSKEGWVWINSGYVVDYTMKFHAGQPDHRRNEERCLSIYRKNSKLALNDEACSNKHRFICQLVLTDD